MFCGVCGSATGDVGSGFTALSRFSTEGFTASASFDGASKIAVRRSMNSRTMTLYLYMFFSLRRSVVRQGSRRAQVRCMGGVARFQLSRSSGKPHRKDS